MKPERSRRTQHRASPTHREVFGHATSVTFRLSVHLRMLNNNVVTQLQKQLTHFNLSWRNSMFIIFSSLKKCICMSYEHAFQYHLSFKIVISKFNTKSYSYQIWGISDPHESSNSCQQVPEVFEILSTQVDPVQRIFWNCVDAVAQAFKQIFLAVNTVLTF